MGERIDTPGTGPQSQFRERGPVPGRASGGRPKSVGCNYPCEVEHDSSLRSVGSLAGRCAELLDPQVQVRRPSGPTGHHGVAVDRRDLRVVHRAPPEEVPRRHVRRRVGRVLPVHVRIRHLLGVGREGRRVVARQVRRRVQLEVGHRRGRRHDDELPVHVRARHRRGVGREGRRVVLVLRNGVHDLRVVRGPERRVRLGQRVVRRERGLPDVGRGRAREGRRSQHAGHESHDQRHHDERRLGAEKLRHSNLLGTGLSGGVGCPTSGTTSTFEENKRVVVDGIATICQTSTGGCKTPVNIASVRFGCQVENQYFC